MPLGWFFISTEKRLNCSLMRWKKARRQTDGSVSKQKTIEELLEDLKERKKWSDNDREAMIDALELALSNLKTNFDLFEVHTGNNYAEMLGEQEHEIWLILSDTQEE